MHLSEVIYLFKSQYLQSEDVSSEDIIEHYGVLGQKWGVRHDRKSTSSGRSKSAPKTNTKTKPKTKTSLITININRSAKSDAKKATEAKVEKSKKKVSVLKQAVEKAKEIKTDSKPKSVHELSDSELRERINRLNMEKQYSDLMKSQVSALNPPKQKSATRKFMENVGQEAAKAMIMGAVAIATEKVVKPYAASLLAPPSHGRHAK